LLRLAYLNITNAAELVRRLIALNAEIVKGMRSYDPFGEF
jgi:hypothetical protein